MGSLRDTRHTHRYSRPACWRTETLFQATASTLIYGDKDAVLVDAYLTTKQTTALADWVASKGKSLTTIYITHGHGDHLESALFSNVSRAPE